MNESTLSHSHTHRPPPPTDTLSSHRPRTHHHDEFVFQIHSCSLRPIGDPGWGCQEGAKADEPADYFILQRLRQGVWEGRVQTQTCPVDQWQAWRLVRHGPPLERGHGQWVSQQYWGNPQVQGGEPERDGVHEFWPWFGTVSVMSVCWLSQTYVDSSH